MEKKFFPIFIDFSNKKVVVIGGGVIASRRVKTLAEFTEHITVVAPEITPALSELHQYGEIKWLKEHYKIEQLQEADMVIAATNQPELNHQIKKDCQQLELQNKKNILVSVIDDKEQCDFYFPSIVEKEGIVIGINSGGKSPKQTKAIREKIEKLLNSESIYE